MNHFRQLLCLGALAWLTAAFAASPATAATCCPNSTDPPATSQDPSRPMFGGSVGTSGGGFTDPARPQFGGSIGSSSGGATP
ncbi:hypothetical protein GCM10023185_38870 [Hymenobacter saemangeumensis]|uniref:Uncharacterized protein n=1 Tax=Hymenobacter saemangeumensis TaxID=1084522 RepID=A0ABP8IQL9_9BACT